MQVLVLEVDRVAPKLGVSVAYVGVDGGGVQAESWVPVEVPELGGVGHADQDQAVLEKTGFHGTDPGVPIGAERGQHAQIARRGEPADEDFGDPRGLMCELAPGDHQQ